MIASSRLFQAIPMSAHGPKATKGRRKSASNSTPTTAPPPADDSPGPVIRRRVGKRVLMMQLSEENSSLKSAIADLHQQLAAIDAENTILSESISFFQAQIGTVKAARETDAGSVPASETQ
jgi:hypothetical protein